MFVRNFTRHTIFTMHAFHACNKTNTNANACFTAECNVVYVHDSRHVTNDIIKIYLNCTMTYTHWVWWNTSSKQACFSSTLPWVVQHYYVFQIMIHTAYIVSNKSCDSYHTTDASRSIVDSRNSSMSARSKSCLALITPLHDCYVHIYTFGRKCS